MTCSEPVIVSDLRDGAKMPSVAINERGDAAIAWIGTEKFQESIQVSLKNSEGNWSYPVNVSGGPVVIWGLTQESLPPPRCFLGEEGDAYVFWKKWIREGVEYVEKLPYRDWSVPVSLKIKQGYCNVIFGGKGQFWFLDDKKENGWIYHESVTAQVHLKRPNHPEVEIWTPPGAEHGWFDPLRRSCGEAIGLNQRGDIFVIWRRGTDITHDSFQGCWLLSDGSFANTEEVSRQFGSLDAFLSGIVVDNQKNIGVVGVKENKVQALTQIDGGWSEWIPLSEEDEKKGSWFMPRPQVAIDHQGNILVVWKTERENCIEGAYKAFGQEWTFLDTIFAEGPVEKILLRSDHKNGFILLWEEKKDRKKSGIYAVEFSREQGPILQLSPEHEFCAEPSLEFAVNGKGLLAWTRKTSAFDSCIEVVDVLLGP